MRPPYTPLNIPDVPNTIMRVERARKLSGKLVSRSAQKCKFLKEKYLRIGPGPPFWPPGPPFGPGPLTFVRFVKLDTRSCSGALSVTGIIRSDVFLPILDSVIAGLSTRFNAVQQINSTFSFLWLYTDMSEDEIVSKSTNFAQIYNFFNWCIWGKAVRRSAAAEKYSQLKFWT